MGTEVEEESRPASDAVYDAVMTSECSASAKSATLHRGGRARNKGCTSCPPLLAGTALLA